MRNCSGSNASTAIGLAFEPEVVCVEGWLPCRIGASRRATAADRPTEDALAQVAV
jgi:hypothetical protein